MLSLTDDKCVAAAPPSKAELKVKSPIKNHSHPYPTVHTTSQLSTTRHDTEYSLTIVGSRR